MSQYAFSSTAGIVFLLLALAHLLRIIFRAPLVVQDISIPIWASGIALVIAAFLSYEGFHLARRPPKH